MISCAALIVPVIVIREAKEDLSRTPADSDLVFRVTDCLVLIFSGDVLSLRLFGRELLRGGALRPGDWSSNDDNECVGEACGIRSLGAVRSCRAPSAECCPIG